MLLDDARLRSLSLGAVDHSLYSAAYLIEVELSSKIKLPHPRSEHWVGGDGAVRPLDVEPS